MQDSSSVGDGNTSRLYALGVIAGTGGAISSNILFQNMNVTITTNDPPFHQYGNSSSVGFIGLYLSGAYAHVDTRAVNFLFPSSVTYDCNLSCSSSMSPSVCACIS